MNENAKHIQSNVDITELVRLIFVRAIEAGASDVHIEPTLDAVRIRFRIDGVLYDQGTIPSSELNQIVTHLKVLAGLDIATKPIPQDGHFELDTSVFEVQNPLAEKSNSGEFQAGWIEKKQKRILDVRISIFPAINGDAAVCRLLNRSDTVFSLDELGLDQESLKTVRRLIGKSYGMVLVTGPVGAGKTTTLYSILAEIMGKEKNAITLEDPVEFRFDTARQIQMQPERGMTFAVGMKSILRQDPDIIMIGEIRDKETAEHAVRASLVGRIVFSTIHSNTSIGTIARLIDMDIERSLIAYAVSGIISTRLVKKICEQCKVAHVPADEYLIAFGLDKTSHQFFRGTGCKHCANTGFKGRTGIFEVLEFDDKLRTMIVDRASMAELQSHVENNRMKTLAQDAIEKVLAGVTTLENVAHTV